MRNILEVPLRYTSVWFKFRKENPDYLIPRVLIYGPNKVGKRLMFQAIAHETRTPFFYINCEYK